MSIFEDKKHNDPKYVGQVPVKSVPEDIMRRNRMSYAEGNRSQLPWPHGVRSVPNAGDTGENK